MANGANTVIVSGNLGADSELKYTANGKAQAKLSLAVNQSYKKGEEWVDDTLWLTVILWGDAAERLTPKLTKGTPVLVEGRLSIRTWNKDDGTRVYFTEVIANRVHIFGRLPKANDGEAPANAGSASDFPWDE